MKQLWPQGTSWTIILLVKRTRTKTSSPSQMRSWERWPNLPASYVYNSATFSLDSFYRYFECGTHRCSQRSGRSFYSLWSHHLPECACKKSNVLSLFCARTYSTTCCPTGRAVFRSPQTRPLAGHAPARMWVLRSTTPCIQPRAPLPYLTLPLLPSTCFAFSASFHLESTNYFCFSSTSATYIMHCLFYSFWYYFVLCYCDLNDLHEAPSQITRRIITQINPITC